MKLSTFKLPDHVALAFAAETQAERYQMEALLDALTKQQADVVEWDNMEGSSGFTVRVRLAAVSKVATEKS